jgi:hypothetical protein
VKSWLRIRQWQPELLRIQWQLAQFNKDKTLAAEHWQWQWQPGHFEIKIPVFDILNNEQRPIQPEQFEKRLITSWLGIRLWQPAHSENRLMTACAIWRQDIGSLWTLTKDNDSRNISRKGLLHLEHWEYANDSLSSMTADTFSRKGLLHPWTLRIVHWQPEHFEENTLHNSNSYGYMYKYIAYCELMKTIPQVQQSLDLIVA